MAALYRLSDDQVRPWPSSDAVCQIESGPLFEPRLLLASLLHITDARIVGLSAVITISRGLYVRARAGFRPSPFPVRTRSLR
jgi:hypothetical protein